MNFIYFTINEFKPELVLVLFRQGHLQMVIQLLKYGADLSIADGEGYRPLHLAILFQHMAVAAYLMAKGQVPQQVLMSDPLPQQHQN